MAYGDRRERPRVTKAREWRAEIPPEDTAPPVAPSPRVEDWGRTQDEARDMLRRQMCPVCGEGPWGSPINHASRKHGIRGRDLREACGITSVESVVPVEVREKMSASQAARGIDAEGMARLSGLRRGGRRFTEAGRTEVARNLSPLNEPTPENIEQKRRAAALTKTPGALAKRSATFRAKKARREPT